MMYRWLGLCAALYAAPALAKPVAPEAFCGVYPEVGACASGPAACTTCHVQPPQRNLFGAQLDKALLPDVARPLESSAYLEALPAALAAIEGLDADADGFTNLEELQAGTSPADARSTPGEAACPQNVGAGFDVCNYDAPYVFKKLHLDFCGHSPTRKAMDEIRASDDPMGVLHAALDACLDSDFWIGRDGQVWNLANSKIRPLASIKAGEGAGDIPLADYLDDYAFFVYTHSDDRDVREVLTGRYFVERNPPTEDEPTTYTTWNRTPQQEFDVRGFGPAQLVNEGRRAGMLTHRWFLMSNTMFTGVPRTTAAQAYRAYLGLDISRLEGLDPIEGEPVDYDQKGVAEPECARCHSTLDPLTYPFTRYEGIGGGAGRRIPFSYNGARNNFFTAVDGEGMRDMPEAGVIFGETVEDLIQWARVAADSDPFAQATVMDYWVLLMGERPRPEEMPEFDTLWTGLKTTHEYRVERMLHALIETEAYGVP